MAPILSAITRGRIVGMWEGGVSTRRISEVIGCTIKTVDHWVRKFVAEGEEGLKDHRKNNSGVKKTTNEEDLQILRSIDEDPFKPANSLVRELNLNIKKTPFTRG